MILYLSIVGAVAVAAVACRRMWQKHSAVRERQSRDPHWGDVPPDQMGP